MNEYGGHKTLIQGMEKGPCALRKPTQECPLCGLNYDYYSNEMGTQRYHKSLVYGTHAGRFSLTLGNPASLHNHYYMINFVIFFSTHKHTTRLVPHTLGTHVNKKMQVSTS